MVNEPQGEPRFSQRQRCAVSVRDWNGQAMAKRPGTSTHGGCGGHHADTVAEKRKAASRRPSHNALISLGEIGAGEGIRTLDPNLGKVALLSPQSFR
jgi:hypothetical protein